MRWRERASRVQSYLITTQRRRWAFLNAIDPDYMNGLFAATSQTTYVTVRLHVSKIKYVPHVRSSYGHISEKNSWRDLSSGRLALSLADLESMIRGHSARNKVGEVFGDRFIPHRHQLGRVWERHKLHQRGRGAPATRPFRDIWLGAYIDYRERFLAYEIDGF